ISLLFMPYQGSRGVVEVEVESGSVLLAEGDYRVIWEPLPAGYTVKSLMSGSIDLLANPLRISAKTPPKPIVITLVALSAGPRVSGLVTGSESIPSGPVMVKLRPSARASTRTAWFENPEALVNPDGSFEFPMVPPGSYDIRLSPAWPVSPDALNVSHQGLKNLDIILAAPAAREVRGRVRFATPGIRKFSFSFILSGPGGDVTVTADLEPDGTFKASFPEGEYSVGLGLPAGYRMQAMTYGASDLQKERIRIGVDDRDELFITAITPNVRLIADAGLALRCVSCVMPEYPGLARTARVGDTVRLSVDVARDGTVRDARVISGHQLLRQVALEAVRKWRFQTETVNGESIEFTGDISISFAFE
ncbi:MAG TPA: energy transducer TonB, partial [Terriglobia bacterium]|nr:energy transducer TonB [Terriglobia bacterium]